jgi:valacyclovir hydrolase
MAWFEHNGSRIYFEDEGHGSPVLFLPGWSESIDQFAAIRRGIAGEHRLISADLPGSGRSGPQPRDYAPTYYHDDARSFLALLQHLEAGPAHVAGFSDGGEIALVMAALQPEAVRSVVAWGAAGIIAAGPEVLAAIEHLIDAPDAAMAEFSEHLKTTYGEAGARALCQGAARAWRAIAAAGGDIVRSRAAEIAAPALLITGEHDPFAPPDVVSELAGAIPRGEFIEIKGADHDLHREHGEWLIAAMLEWLRRSEG